MSSLKEQATQSGQSIESPKVKGVLPKAIKETKVGRVNPNLVGKPKPSIVVVVGKKALPPMPSKVPAKGKPQVASRGSKVKSYAQTMGGPKKGTPTVKKMK